MPSETDLPGLISGGFPKILMKKNIFLAFSALLVAGLLYAADTVKLNRLGAGIQVTGGTTSTNGKTLIVSESPTNEFRVLVVTATVAGAQTSYTNTFSEAFLATPVVAQCNVSSSTQIPFLSATPSTTKVYVDGLNSAGTTNNIPFIVYGYVRTGVRQ